MNVSSIQTPSRRAIRSYESNLAPSVRRGNLAEDTQEHAYLRLQIHATLSVAYYKTALRSSGKLARVNLEAKGARIQIGRGSGRYHASHANTAAGLCDNRRKQIMKEICKENAVTPRKKRILKAKGFSERQLKQLVKTSLSNTKFKSLFNKVWSKYAQSIVDGTTLNLVANGSTTELPKQLNLQCDGRLERTTVRKQIPIVFKEIMQGTCSPETSTKNYCFKIQGYLQNSITELKERIKILKDLKNMFAASHPSLTTAQVAELKKAKSKLARSSPGATKAKDNLLKNLNKFIEGNKKSFKSLFKKRGSETRNAIDEQIEYYKTLRSYAKNELKGTQMPPFEQLIGNYDAATKSFVPLTSTEMKDLQMKLLRPAELDSPPPVSSKPTMPRGKSVRKKLF